MYYVSIGLLGYINKVSHQFCCVCVETDGKRLRDERAIFSPFIPVGKVCVYIFGYFCGFEGVS